MIELTVTQRKKIANIIGECEMCGKTCTPHPHRIKRNYHGGKYILRNIMWVCTDCHRMLHYNEPGMRKV